MQAVKRMFAGLNRMLDGIEARRAAKFPPVLPSHGHVRGPDGVVHYFIGDNTMCSVQWAAVSPRYHVSVKTVGWDVVEEPITCMQCSVEA